MSDKAAQRTELLIHLGQVLAPLESLANASPPPSREAYIVLAAQLGNDLSRWMQEYGRFATIGDVHLQRESRAFRLQCSRLKLHIGQCADVGGSVASQLLLRGELPKLKKVFIALIDRIPIDWEPILTASKLPFTVSMMIGDAVGGARTRLDYFDRYLDPDFFPLYLRRLDRSVAVRLITTPGNTSCGVTAVQAVARLAAQEFKSFQLIQCTHLDIHDRNLRVDNQVFHLGTSMNSAGKHPTNFTPGDSTANGHQILDGIIAKGTVVV